MNDILLGVRQERMHVLKTKILNKSANIPDGLITSMLKILLKSRLGSSHLLKSGTRARLRVKSKVGGHPVTGKD